MAKLTEGTINGHVEQRGSSWAVIIDGEVSAVRADEESALNCLMHIYLFRSAPSDNDNPNQ